jgi:hypothetical protein
MGPGDIGIDSFQADRAPDHTYKSQNLAAVFVRERGLFMFPENKYRGAWPLSTMG